MASSTSAVFLVTGSSRGLGLEFVRQLLERGNSVIATCRDPASASALHSIIAHHVKKDNFAHVIDLDVANAESIFGLPNKLDDLSVKSIDVLIHNAGVTAPTHPDDPFASATAKALHDCFDVNAVGPLLLTQALLPKLRESATKKVFFVSTVMSSLNLTTTGGSVSYRVTKCAENMVAKCLAGEHGLGSSDRLLVTLCHPGWCDTDMGSAGGRTPPVSPSISIEGMLKVIDSMGAPHSTANFLDYTGSSVEF